MSALPFLLFPFFFYLIAQGQAANQQIDSNYFYVIMLSSFVSVLVCFESYMKTEQVIFQEL